MTVPFKDDLENSLQFLTLNFTPRVSIYFEEKGILKHFRVGKFDGERIQ